MILKLNNNEFFIQEEQETYVSLTIKQRKQRDHRILNKFLLLKFTVGDILIIVYWKKSIVYRFEGICLSIKKNSFTNPNVSLLLRNMILGVGIELIVSYYFNRIHRLVISDHKRKDFLYKKSKLYYLRQRLNRASKIH